MASMREDAFPASELNQWPTMWISLWLPCNTFRVRERLSTANLKEPLRATRLSAPSGNNYVLADHKTVQPDQQTDPV